MAYLKRQFTIGIIVVPVAVIVFVTSTGAETPAPWPGRTGQASSHPGLRRRLRPICLPS